ncbi:hypothetical protein [Nocardioides montaniterrae]
MTGHNLERLKHLKHGLNSDDVRRSQIAWSDGASSLKAVIDALGGLSPKAITAFGDSETGRSAKGTLDTMQKNLAVRHRQMKTVAAKLDTAANDMWSAEQTPIPNAPGPAPTKPSPIGSSTNATVAEHDMNQYNEAKQHHAAAVTAYGTADSDAETKVNAVNQSYDAAAAALAEIHGDPAVGSPSSSSSGSTPTYGGTGHTGTRHPSGYTSGVITGTHHHHSTSWSSAPGSTTSWDPSGGPSTGEPPTGTPTSTYPPDYPSTDPTDTPAPNPGADPTSTGGPGGPGMSPLMAGGGAIGAGVLGGFGIRSALNSLRPTIEIPGSSANEIGASARSTGSGVLGGKSTGAGSGSGRGSGTGSAGSGSGRGDKKGKRGKGEEYDVDEDWTEDDGQFPGVLS